MSSDTPNKLERALFHLKNAIQLLDEAGAPPEIASHVDMSIHILERQLTGNIGRRSRD